MAKLHASLVQLIVPLVVGIILIAVARLYPSKKHKWLNGLSIGIGSFAIALSIIMIVLQYL